MPKQPHITALNEPMNLGGKSGYRTDFVATKSARTKASSFATDKAATKSAIGKAENGYGPLVAPVCDSFFLPCFQSSDLPESEFATTREFASHNAVARSQIPTDTKPTIRGKSHRCDCTALTPNGSCHPRQAVDQSGVLDRTDDAPPDPPQPDPPQTESAAAAGTRNGAESSNEVCQLPKQDTALIAARHPILAMHWGALV